MTKEQKLKKAIALKYEKGKREAPVVTATGQGLIAERIIDKARENDVYMRQDSTLVELLGNLEINEKIPEELYNTVAEVFAFIYQMDKNVESSEKNK